MRLTFRVTTSGEQWAVQSPHIDFKKCWPNDADFDEPEFRREIRAFDDLVMMGSKPGERCALRFASIFLDQFDGWRADCNDDAKLKAAGKFNAIRATVNGRMKREKYGCVRVRIDPIVRPFAGKVYHALRVRVDRTDRGVPNIAEATRYCAMVVSFILREIDRDLRAHGQPPCELGDEVLGYAAARDREYYAARAKESNAMRGECERNANGYCSPCKFDCPHYRAGRCVDAENLTDEATLMKVPHMAKRMEQLRAERQKESEKEASNE